MASNATYQINLTQKSKDDSSQITTYTGKSTTNPSTKVSKSKVDYQGNLLGLTIDPNGDVRLTAKAGEDPFGTLPVDVTYKESGNKIVMGAQAPESPVSAAEPEDEDKLNPGSIDEIQKLTGEFIVALTSQIDAFDVKDPYFAPNPKGTGREYLDDLFTDVTTGETSTDFQGIDKSPEDFDKISENAKIIVQGIRGELGENRPGGQQRSEQGQKTFEGIPQILLAMSAGNNADAKKFKSFLMIGEQGKFGDFFPGSELASDKNSNEIAVGCFDTIKALGRTFGATSEIDDKLDSISRTLTEEQRKQIGMSAPEGDAPTDPDDPDGTILSGAPTPEESEEDEDADTGEAAGESGEGTPPAVAALSDNEVKAAKTQIEAVLEKLQKGLDDPDSVSGEESAPGAPTMGLADGAAYLDSDYVKDGVFNNELDKMIDELRAGTRIAAPTGGPFINRTGSPKQANNERFGRKFKEKAAAELKYALGKSENKDVLKLLKAGKTGVLTANSGAETLYNNVMQIATVLSVKKDVDAYLDATKVTSSGSVQAPPAPAPAPSASTGAVGSSGVAAAGGTGSGGESGSASTQPGAGAAVNPIAVAAVQILNARPVPVDVVMEFGEPDDESGPQDPLKWSIDPAYFGGYQLQIGNNQRAAIARYTGKQVILKASITPITGGRPVELKQTLVLRPRNIPDDAALLPIKTFVAGRMSGSQEVRPQRAAVGGARNFSDRNAEVPCFFYDKDGGIGSPAGDTVSVRTAAGGRTYRFDFPQGFLVPIRIKVDEAKSPKLKAKLDALKSEQKLLEESKRGLINEAGVPHWIFLKRRGALDTGRGKEGAGGESDADSDAASGLRVNIAVKSFTIKTNEELRVVGNVGTPWEEGSFKPTLYPGKGSQFDKNEFPDAGLILCEDDFGLFSGLNRDAVYMAMYRVLFTDRAPASSAYKLMGIQKWANDLKVIGSNPDTSATAREKPDRIYATS